MTRWLLAVGAVDRPLDLAVARSVTAAAIEAGATVTVLAPPGTVADHTTALGAAHESLDDLEPLAPTAAAGRAADRRARSAARAHRTTLTSADVVVVIGVEAIALATRARPDARVVAVVHHPPVGPARETLRRHRGHIDLVATGDPRVTAGLAPNAPPIVAFDTIASVGPAIVAALGASPARALPPHTRPEPAFVFAVPDYLPSLGGTTRQAQNQATAVEAAGGRAIVLTQRIERSWPRRQRIDRIEVVRLGPVSRHRVAMKVFVTRAAVWLRRRRSEIGVVSAVMYPDLAVSAALAGLGSRAVVIWAGLGDATDTLARRGWGARRALVEARRALLRPVTHVALTPAIADELAALGIRERVVVIPTPVDVDRFRAPSPARRAEHRAALGVPADATVVVYVGQLRALKRVDRLIEAFATLAAEQPGLHLFLVGGSRDDLEDRTDELRALVHRLGVSSAVTFTGFTEDVLPYLHAGDVFVLPSDREGLSNSLLEAMVSGLACVAPASAGGDQVLDPTTGIVPPTNSVADLTDALRSLVTDPERRAALGIAATRTAEQYSVAAIDARYRALFATLGAPVGPDDRSD